MNLTVEIAGTNSYQAQQPGCRCAELPPAWHGVCHAQQSLQPPAAPHLGRDGPWKDQSGGKGACWSKSHAKSVPQQQPWMLVKSQGGGPEGCLPQRELTTQACGGCQDWPPPDACRYPLCLRDMVDWRWRGAWKIPARRIQQLFPESWAWQGHSSLCKKRTENSRRTTPL